MRTIVRGYTVDPTSSKFTNDQLDAIMARAALSLWDILLMDDRGKQILRTKQSPQVLLSNWDEYPFPSDVLRIEQLETRLYTTLYATLTTGAVGTTTIGDWNAITAGTFRIRINGANYDITGVSFASDSDMDAVASTLQTAIRAATGGGETCTYDSDDTAFIISSYDRVSWVQASPLADATDRPDISGSGFMNGRQGSGTPAVTVGAPDWLLVPRGRTESYPQRSGTLAANSVTGSSLDGWYELDNQTARLTPLQSSPNGIYRFGYFRAPVFPTEDYEAFINLPDGVDDLVEYMATVLCGFNKIEDDGAKVEISAFGDMFRSKLETFLAGRGGGLVRPTGRIQLTEA